MFSFMMASQDIADKKVCPLKLLTSDMKGEIASESSKYFRACFIPNIMSVLFIVSQTVLEKSWSN